MSLAGGAVQHAESVLVLVEEAGAAREQDLHHARVPLLHRAPQRGRAVLALGVNILAHLRGKILHLRSKNIFYCSGHLDQQLGHVPQAGDGGVVQRAVAELVPLRRRIFILELQRKVLTKVRYH